MSLVCLTPPLPLKRYQGADESTGKHHIIQPGMESSAKLTEILKNVLSSVTSAMKAPVCRSTVKLDLRSKYIRVDEVRVSYAAQWDVGFTLN